MHTVLPNAGAYIYHLERHARRIGVDILCGERSGGHRGKDGGGKKGLEHVSHKRIVEEWRGDTKRALSAQ